jgi:hypothetical protein
MTTINDGGPAFPQGDDGSWGTGMTLRDWFATHATDGDIMNILKWTECTRQKARYIHADAMLTAREVKP